MLIAERIIQLSGNRALTNKGRVFESWVNNGVMVWVLLSLPDFEETKLNTVPQGKSIFIENISPKERFEAANTIDDLLN